MSQTILCISLSDSQVYLMRQTIFDAPNHMMRQAISCVSIYNVSIFLMRQCIWCVRLFRLTDYLMDTSVQWSNAYSLYNASVCLMPQLLPVYRKMRQFIQCIRLSNVSGYSYLQKCFGILFNAHIYLIRQSLFMSPPLFTFLTVHFIAFLFSLPFHYAIFHRVTTTLFSVSHFWHFIQ